MYIGIVIAFIMYSYCGITAYFTVLYHLVPFGGLYVLNNSFIISLPTGRQYVLTHGDAW